MQYPFHQVHGLICYTAGKNREIDLQSYFKPDPDQAESKGNFMKIEACKAIVTGGASGPGEACVRSLAACGADAAILDMAVERGQMLASLLGGKVIFLQVDVCSCAGAAHYRKPDAER